MRLVHDPDGTDRTLASDVETADSLFSQVRGLMFRRSIPDDYALCFRFGGVKRRDVHMLFVPFPLDVVWTVDGVVTHVAQLSPWTGFDRASGDAIHELPAGTADAVTEGDVVRLDA